MLIAILLLGSHPKPKGLGFPAQDCNIITEENELSAIFP